MNFCSEDRFASAAHKVFDTWSEPGTQPGSEGNHAQHMFDTIPNPQGRVLHVVVHQYQQSVSPELISQVFSAYGEVEEMFHSPHQNSPTSASSIFIEYAHASMADDALHGLHGLYLYQDDCWLEIRHANNSELQAFYGYSAPSFSEEQLELLQQIKKDLQALSQNGTFGLVDVCMGTDLKPTPPTQNNHNAAIFPVSACESLCSEDNQADIDYKEQEKHFKHGPAELQLEFESLLPCAMKTLDAESAMDRASVDNIDQVLHQWPTKEQQFNDNSSATLAALPVAIPILDDSEEIGQNVAEVEKILTPAVFPMSQPWASHLDSNYQQPVTSMTLHSAPSQKKVPHVLALIPGSNNVREPSVIISDLCGHIKTNRLMLPWDPGTLHCTHWEVSKPIKEGKFSCLQFVLLWFTMNYTVIHSTYLTCLCTSLPWEDPGDMHVMQSADYIWSCSRVNIRLSEHEASAQNDLVHCRRICSSWGQGEMQVLQGTENKWIHSVVAILIKAMSFSDMCQALEIYENHLVCNFQLNEAAPTNVTMQSTIGAMKLQSTRILCFPQPPAKPPEYPAKCIFRVKGMQAITLASYPSPVVAKLQLLCQMPLVMVRANWNGKSYSETVHLFSSSLITTGPNKLILERTGSCATLWNDKQLLDADIAIQQQQHTTNLWSYLCWNWSSSLLHIHAHFDGHYGLRWYLHIIVSSSTCLSLEILKALHTVSIPCTSHCMVQNSTSSLLSAVVQVIEKGVNFTLGIITLESARKEIVAGAANMPLPVRLTSEPYLTGGLIFTSPGSLHFARNCEQIIELQSTGATYACVLPAQIKSWYYDCSVCPSSRYAIRHPSSKQVARTTTDMGAVLGLMGSNVFLAKSGVPVVLVNCVYQFEESNIERANGKAAISAATFSALLRTWDESSVGLSFSMAPTLGKAMSQEEECVSLLVSMGFSAKYFHKSERSRSVLGASCKLAQCFHIWISTGFVPMCHCHPTWLSVQYADENSETSWQQCGVLVKRMAALRDPSDTPACNDFTNQRGAPSTTSDWINYHDVEISVLEPATTIQVSTFLGRILTDLKVMRPWDPGVRKPILLTRADYPVTLSKSMVIGRSKVMSWISIVHISTLSATTYHEQQHLFEANFTQDANSKLDTWDPGSNVYRTLQPASDTHHMASTCHWTTFTNKRVGLHYKIIAHLLHLQFMSWIRDLWIISFRPP